MSQATPAVKTILGYMPRAALDALPRAIGISIYNVAPSAEHTWYYYPRMSPDEVLVIKSYDPDGVIGRCCPHTSFIGADTARS